MAERTKRREGWGWETPWDLYQAIQKLMGAGDLAYRQVPGGHEFGWYMPGIRKLFRIVISDEELMLYAVNWIAVRFVAEGKETFRRSV